MSAQSNYVRFPTIDISGTNYVFRQEAAPIGEYMQQIVGGNKKNVTVECYPGVNQDEILNIFSRINPELVIHSDDLAFEPEKMDALLEQDLMPTDPVFGIMTVRELKDYFYPQRLEQAREAIENTSGIVLIYLVYCPFAHLCRSFFIYCPTAPPLPLQSYTTITKTYLQFNKFIVLFRQF